MALKLYCNYNMFDKEQKILSYDDEIEKLEVIATCSTDQLTDTLLGLLAVKPVLETNLKGPEQILSKTAQDLKKNIYKFGNNKVRININGELYN